MAVGPPSIPSTIRRKEGEGKRKTECSMGSVPLERYMLYVRMPFSRIGKYEPHPQGVHCPVEEPRNPYATYVPMGGTDAQPGKGREANIPGPQEKKHFPTPGPLHMLCPQPGRPPPVAVTLAPFPPSAHISLLRRCLSCLLSVNTP